MKAGTDIRIEGEKELFVNMQKHLVTLTDNSRKGLRKAGMNIIGAIQRFMAGRYGHDRLNITMLVVGCVLCFVKMFVPSGAGFVLTILSEALLILSLFRCFSRNTYKRYQENRKFLLLLDRVKDREHRYFTCPRCRQPVRVPKGKGKIAITCPKCKEKFVRKT